MKTIQSTVSTPDELYPFHQPLEQIAFFDIETTGLSPKTSSIYLIGVMHYNSHKQSWQITQWFADDYQSEEPILGGIFILSGGLFVSLSFQRLHL